MEVDIEMSNAKYSDDAKVEWMQLRADGLTCGVIGEMYGVTSTYIRAETNRIILADAKHHPDKIRFS